MNLKYGLMAVAMATAPMVVGAVPARSQTVAASASGWRTVAPENLLVIDTSKGRVFVELEPRMAPNHVERIRTLANQGFYDGVIFHRVLAGFMAQTGDPTGTGTGNSELPDIAAELNFRRGRDSDFVEVPDSGEGRRGILGSVPVVTQPDAQMFVTADFKTAGQGLFCPGVAGMARSSGVDSANSQFFLMMGASTNLDGAYTPFGRTVIGHDVVTGLKTGSEATDGRVADGADVMTRVRTASAMPAAERPAVRILTTTAPEFSSVVDRARAARGRAFNICDVQLPAELMAN